MEHITVDLTKITGQIKPLHGVNNGPFYGAVSPQYADPLFNNYDHWVNAGIPYGRTHDSNHCYYYGGPHIIDMEAVFPNFDADPCDPASYDFVPTDIFLASIEKAGTKVFYRLGEGIQHWIKKYDVFPPKDFKKWAVICEHIIRHCTEGWADGHHFDIEYWEIWNEPDLCRHNPSTSPTWQGTPEQYFELYNITARHLKSCFPHLKIGGPALAGDMEWAENFLNALDAPLDFFSWHCYTTTPAEEANRARQFRRLLDRHGLTACESINNEWNYVKGWSGEESLYSHKVQKNLKGSSFIAGTMCASQYAPVEMLMYYDARPGGMTGLWETDNPHNLLKGYWPFRMFNTLYKLGNALDVSSDCGELYACAAKNDTDAAVLLTHFADVEEGKAKDVALSLTGCGNVKVKIETLDETHDMTVTREETFTGNDPVLSLTLPLFTTALITITEHK